jgi:hypothetical protein
LSLKKLFLVSGPTSIPREKKQSSNPDKPTARGVSARGLLGLMVKDRPGINACRVIKG